MEDLTQAAAKAAQDAQAAIAALAGPQESWIHSPGFVNLVYLLAAICFIWTFKLLAHPRTATRGNVLGMVGMLLAIAMTLLDRGITGYTLIVIGVLIGAGIGIWFAIKVPMTSMPQMVGILNGFGGGASFLVAWAALLEFHHDSPGVYPGLQFMIATALSGIIGAVTFSGSAVAADKLQEWFLPSKPIWFPRQQLVNAALGLVAVALGWLLVTHHAWTWLYFLIVLVSLGLGVLLVIPIGGADMPVVICLMNSYSGLAGAATGFVLNNNVLVIAGSLVGASGLILTRIMCKAMNRSMTNVVFGRFGGGEQGVSADEIYKTVKSTSPEEVAMLFDNARRVVIVPGYGMAVSQCQHAVRDLANLLESRGIEVEFGIHPVAGRMPGHMNVLLAEANVPYDKMKEMDEINPTMEETDVAIVLGANDTVNPIARTDPKSPIAGMPIIDVDKARTVVVIKRSLSPGFAGIPNPLFAAPNVLMLFGDGKKAMLELIAAVKES
jgi:NAD(P) transhydrogenase subunit beta